MYENLTFEKSKETLKALVEINSISKGEAKLAEHVKERCSAMGMTAVIDRHGNVIAKKKFSENGIVFAMNSHMDTVDIGEAWTEKPFGCRMDGTKMYGLGSDDCKGAMAGMLMALEEIMANSDALALKGELVFTAVVQEEVQGEWNKGTWKMIKDGFSADMAMIGEPTSMEICRGCEGMTEVTVTTQGVPVHASNAEKGVNAINAMVKIIDGINAKLKPGYSDILGSGSINVGVIEGGNRSSVVPDKCVMKVAKFVVEGESGQQFCDQITEIIAELKRADPSLNAVAACTYSSFAGVVPESTPLVSYLKKATSKVMGKEAPVVGMRAHLDSDFLINIAKIPCVTFGPGDMPRAHTADEWIDVADIATAAKVYAEAIIEAMK
jgi:acetylornithine deacetylase/succinyl-diaminopimelate desuccinylase family protein